MGQKDIELNQKGLEQADKAADLLKNIQFSSIITSPLKRALKTAQIISKHNKTKITIIDNLKECSWGIMEGKLKDKKLIKSWIEGEDIENSETFISFKEKIIEAMIKALNINQAPLLIVAHGAVYWAIPQALNLPLIDLTNCYPLYHEPPKELGNSWTTHNL